MAVQTVPVPRDRVAEAGNVLARAFQEDPLYANILTDPEERRLRMPAMFIALVKYSRLYGECTTTPDLDGVACWLRPGKTNVTLWRILRAGFGLQTSVASFSPDARRRFLSVMGYADSEHKRLMPRPHWYLWALGVEPARQRQGVGGALLGPVLERADEDPTPCYLETQTAAAVRFYERRGFTVLESGDVPGHGVPFWTMVREAPPRSAV
jgi:ribosomal protein S18 acetylase RimI-like enzyme